MLVPGGKVNSGSVVSIVIRFALSIVVLPHGSVAVNIYSVVDDVPHIEIGPPAANVTVGVPQLSVADPPPLLFIQSLIIIVLLSPHSTIKSEGALTITGFVISDNVMVLVPVVIFMQLSVAVNSIVTGVLHVNGNAVKLLVTSTLLQLSAPEAVFNQLSATARLFGLPHSNVKF